ncbi:hypothetical protein [Methylobacterium nodulans]|uniref:Uncharacterized protein n=1 Tax=Methylobacterium nodulans (strain LMG 21967 / CNCM I-2342 / ORS 2060) TaxID=460265 RepID=B8IBG8_METNO|nr:hypothetical protein [Methylobacterium nodulans]ACL57383.1 hypothetical protein Mnod_2412 [Methylobacterium nodulans ORS 2060]
MVHTKHAATVQVYMNVMREAIETLPYANETGKLDDFARVCHALRQNAISVLTSYLINAPEKVGGPQVANRVLAEIVTMLGLPDDEPSLVSIQRH